MRDLIDRQAAISAVYESAVGKQMLSGHRDLIKILKHLPPAQPEIIKCKDCKWWERITDNIGYCHATKHCHYSSNWEINIYRRQRPEFYCADAERRTYE